MRMRFVGLAAVLAALVLCMARPATAQGLASMAAANAATAATATAGKTPGCFACSTFLGVPYCQGGNVPGYWNCSASAMNLCQLSSPGCGAGASLPVDLDGASQYVSRGSLMGVLASGTSPPEKQNCEGVVVARNQSPDDIVTVRTRTGTLSL